MLKILKYPVKLISKQKLVFQTFNLLLFLCILPFSSCNKTENKTANKTENAFKSPKTKFLADFAENRKKLRSVSFKPIVKRQKANNERSDDPEVYPTYPEYDTLYIYPVNEVVTTYSIEQLRNAGSLQELTDIANAMGAIIRKKPSLTELGIVVTIPVTGIATELLPLIASSKQYLYSLGLTEQDIEDMLSEGGTEEDLIIYAKTLTEIELNHVPEFNDSTTISVVFQGVEEPLQIAHEEITGQEILNCALSAIGADVLFSLGASSATSWSVAAMKTAFKKVAQRFLGPIGVAIAVVSFGACIYSSY